MRPLLAASLFVANVAFAQSQPFIVHDTKPVIMHGPILLDPSETAVTVLWTTDAPSHSVVRYGVDGKLDQRAESVHDGLIDVGTVHRIRITGLEPGRTYSYQVSSTRVVKMKAYWPEKGLETTSDVHRFTTLDRGKSTVRFSSITDTHENVARIDSLMKLVPWSETDFLVHTGDAFDWLDSEDQLFAKWLTPVGKALGATHAMMFARGNHELRGPFARNLSDYLLASGEEYYRTRDAGPVHFYVFDTGEDKPDSTNVYSRLNRVEPYLAAQLEWFRSQAKTDARAQSAPFRVALMHQPNWGWMPNGRVEWVAAANEAKLDLVIAGHNHRFSRSDPGTRGAEFTTVVVGQGQIANVTATGNELTVVVRGSAGAVVDSVTIKRR